MLDIYTDFLISNIGSLAANTRFSDATDKLVSHDKLTRFLNGGAYSGQGESYTGKQLWSFNKKSFKQAKNNEEGIFIFDDMFCPKPYSDESDVNCWHYNHTTGRVEKGICLVNSIFYYPDQDCVLLYKF